MRMYGKHLRMNRLFRRGSGRLLVVPLDHSLADGPMLSADRLNTLIGALGNCGADAVVLHKGRARSIPPDLLSGLSLIVHLSGSTSRSPDIDRKVLVGTVEEAIRIGADAVSVHVNVGSATEADQLADLGGVAATCEQWGVPLLAMMYARGGEAAVPAGSATVAHLAGIAVDLGADIVKTVFTGSVATMREVVGACPVPILVAGGNPKETRAELIGYVDDVLAAGAAGLAMGRNIFGSDRPEALVGEISRLLHGPWSPERAGQEGRTPVGGRSG